MKHNPNKYAEMLINIYRNIKCPLRGKLMYNMSDCLAIQCAINDVNNTIEAINNIESKWLIGCSIKEYYTEVLNILKSKL